MAVSFDDLIAPIEGKVAATTFENYKGRLRTVATVCTGMSPMQILTDPDKAYPMIAANFNGKSGTIANYITPLCRIYREHEDMAKKYIIAYEKWKNYLVQLRVADQRFVEENELPAHRAKNLVSVQEVKAKFCELKELPETYTDRKKNMEFLLMAIFSHITPKRADLGYIRLLVKPPDDDIKVNYILFEDGNRKATLVLTKFKTSFIFNDIRETLPPQLRTLILDSVRLYPRKYLFVDSTGKPYVQNNSYSAFVRRTFARLFDGRKCGVSLYRHAYVSAINYDETPYSELKQTARNMGHSLGTQMKNYRHANRKAPTIPNSNGDVICPPPSQQMGGNSQFVERLKDAYKKAVHRKQARVAQCNHAT